MKVFNKKLGFLAAVLGVLFFWRKKKASGGSESTS
jgi:hypothetical protein